MDMSDIALRELGAMQETVDSLGGSKWTAPTALRGWTVEQLVRHVAEVATRQGEAYQRARLNVSEKPSDAPVMVPTDRLAAALDPGVAEVLAPAFLAHLQKHQPVPVELGRADAVDTADGSHDHHVPSR